MKDKSVLDIIIKVYLRTNIVWTFGCGIFAFVMSFIDIAFWYLYVSLSFVIILYGIFFISLYKKYKTFVTNSKTKDKIYKNEFGDYIITYLGNENKEKMPNLDLIVKEQQNER